IEQSICQARAAVMVYDDANKKWVPAGGSTGFSRVHIYHHTGNNTFRVVGRKIQDHQVKNMTAVWGVASNWTHPPSQPHSPSPPSQPLSPDAALNEIEFDTPAVEGL
uniref:WH1 domain-containing protein n=1 Tax=Laticauda laticaudata TaxID=8630 RepID=A0A8C5WPS6_LATLA